MFKISVIQVVLLLNFTHLELCYVQVFTAGYTNKLIGCSVSPDEVVLVRIYGHRTDLLIDRDKERNSMMILHSVGCAAPLYCRFDNGLAYGYLPGVVLDVDLARKPIVRR